jgi:hypothetical protein
MARSVAAPRKGVEPRDQAGCESPGIYIHSQKGPMLDQEELKQTPEPNPSGINKSLSIGNEGRIYVSMWMRVQIIFAPWSLK